MVVHACSGSVSRAERGTQACWHQQEHNKISSVCFVFVWFLVGNIYRFRDDRAQKKSALCDYYWIILLRYVFKRKKNRKRSFKVLRRAALCTIKDCGCLKIFWKTLRILHHLDEDQGWVNFKEMPLSLKSWPKNRDSAYQNDRDDKRED